MTDGAGGRDGSTTATDHSGREHLTADGIRTYLRCPRQYEFAHVHDVDGADERDDTTDDRVDILRRAICTALERAADETDGEEDTASDDDALEDRAQDRLASLWSDHDERFHSRVQRRHERRVLEATLRAYFEAVGADHAAGIERLRRDASEAGTDSGTDGGADDGRPALVGPGIRLSSTVSLGGEGAADGDSSETPPDTATIDATVDYVYGDGSSVVGVRFVPSIRPLGRLRYRSDWERVADLFVDHFDPESETFEPDPIGALFETAVVIDGLRNYCDRLGLDDRTCRYVQIPLADRSDTSVNWVRETVETSLETVDLTDVYIDHHTYGMTHEHRNETVDDRLESIVRKIESGAFDPVDRWDQIAEHACPQCAYTVCCQEYIAQEVRFDG